MSPLRKEGHMIAHIYVGICRLVSQQMLEAIRSG
jgi:hypothetical protein